MFFLVKSPKTLWMFFSQKRFKRYRCFSIETRYDVFPCVFTLQMMFFSKNALVNFPLQIPKNTADVFLAKSLKTLWMFFLAKSLKR